MLTLLLAACGGSSSNEPPPPCDTGAACTPATACRTGTISCSTGTAVCAETGNVADGTGCGTNQVCGGGACNACTAGATCTSGNPCHTAALVCSSGYPVCADNGNQPDGTSCGTGLTCTAGACGGAALDYIAAGMARNFNVTSVSSGISISMSVTDEISAADPATKRFQRTVTQGPTNCSTPPCSCTYNGFPPCTYSKQIGNYIIESDGSVAVESTLSFLTTDLYGEFSLTPPTTRTVYDPPQLIVLKDTTPGAEVTRVSTATRTVENVTPIPAPVVFTDTRTLSVVGTESVTVPAGTFQALKTSQLIVLSGGATGVSVADLWWTPGVGRTKQTSISGSNSSTFELVSYSPMVCGGSLGANCACNDGDALAASLIRNWYVAADLPVPAGGTISDGLYYLTAVHSCDGTASTRTSYYTAEEYGVISFQSGILQVARNHHDAIVPWNGPSATAAVQVSGTQLTFTPLCGYPPGHPIGAPPGYGPVGFTASSTELWIIKPDPNYTAGGPYPQGYQFVWTKQ